jgi:hypothetical protein
MRCRSGESSGIAVHRLPGVSREQAILPAKNGLLFYGPPG